MKAAEILNRAENPHERLLTCCASHNWAKAMVAARPFTSDESLIQMANDCWFSLDREDWLEAFGGHPRIGDLENLKKKFAETRIWSSQEQAGVDPADETILQRLAQGNRNYEAKFGYIFIVCATGKTAREMLAMLETRLKNPAQVELRIAAEEQAKITHIRLEKLS